MSAYLDAKGGKIMLNEMFQSVIDQDRASVVICNLEHEIVYMNPRRWKIIPNGVERLL